MKTTFNIIEDQITFIKQLIYHFYPGVLIALFYIVVSRYVINLGYPGFFALLLAELFVLFPVGVAHLTIKGKILNGSFSYKNIIPFQEPLTWKQYVKWSLIGIAMCFIVYVPMYPVGLYLRDNVFNWLPEWYFNPGYGTDDMHLIANVFFAGIFIDGFVGPIVEELYFRGYLLPRMAYLKKWAPVVNGALFGLYHFWQPHNYLAITAIGIVLSYVVWKKKNVYIGIIIHCTINVLGAIGGYMAASGGVLIGR